MKVRFCGAAGTTTGSQHLLEINNQKILLECGLYQGKRKETYERNRHFLFDPADVHAVVLSHAHIDHSGNLPNLVKQGFDGHIFCTFATRDLCSIMLQDSARIQQYDIEYLNRKHAKDGLPPLEPIYEERDAERCLRNFVNLGYGRPMQIADGVTITFIDAGHILGSAQVVIDLEERATGRKKRLLFSGDVGRPNNPLLREAEPCEGVDYLIMESTYGGREHLLPSNAEHALADILKAALARKGKVIIPAFAVERTQQLLYAIHDLLVNDLIPDLPIYVDSPLAVSATEIFRIHPECFNQAVYESLFQRQNPFGFENLTLIRSVKGSKELNARKDPCIIISASGMCEAGRILHHLKNNIEDPRNTILFVGYCADNTLGRRIRDKEERVRIFGEEYRLRAHVEALDSFSGHADHSEMLDYFGRISGPKENVWLVHGEPDRCEAMQRALKMEHPASSVEIARLGETVRF